jgi:hypothetical protein
LLQYQLPKERLPTNTSCSSSNDWIGSNYVADLLGWLNSCNCCSHQEVEAQVYHDNSLHLCRRPDLSRLRYPVYCLGNCSCRTKMHRFSIIQWHTKKIRALIVVLQLQNSSNCFASEMVGLVDVSLCALNALVWNASAICPCHTLTKTSNLVCSHVKLSGVKKVVHVDMGPHVRKLLHEVDYVWKPNNYESPLLCPLFALFMRTEKQRRPPFMNDTTMELLRFFIKHDILYLTISIIATKYISNPQSIIRSLKSQLKWTISCNYYEPKLRSMKTVQHGTSKNCRSLK